MDEKIDINILKATICFFKRYNRKEHPDGRFDKQRRWYPSETETCDCCGSIRSPSSNFPYSLLTHCRTVKHISKLYKVEDKDVKKVYKNYKSILADIDGAILEKYSLNKKFFNITEYEAFLFEKNL